MICEEFVNVNFLSMTVFTLKVFLMTILGRLGLVYYL